ncbi:MAG: DUF5667 domain-containing protein [Patescibacteria group bacterium]
MNDKQLFQKLNNLKSIRPDNEWKIRCREILLSQISRGRTVEELEQEKSFSWKIFFGDLLPQWDRIEIARPIWAGAFAIMLLIVGGLVSVHASHNTKPGDSLYIAKIINEKAQFAIAFNEKEKTKLNLEFAINRAKEINQLLDEPAIVELDKNQKVQKLTSNFKKEISQAKIRLNKINVVSGSQTKEDSQFFSANLGKDNQRMEISEPMKPPPPHLIRGEEVKTPLSSIVNVENAPVVETVATTTATTTVENLAKDTTQTASEILNEAEKLFDEKKISESIDKLQEIK